MSGPLVTPPDCGAVGFSPLSGGVSGASVWRAVSEGRAVVVKRTKTVERLALALLAELDDPVLPRVLASGQDEDGEWLMVPFHSGPSCGLLGTPPLQVFTSLGRLHAEFIGRTLPVEFERLDEPFVVRGLTDFGRPAWAGTPGLDFQRLRQRAARLTEGMLDDDGFRTVGERARATLLHGDFYGSNVHLAGPVDASPVLLDWNCARVGPAMFDVAMAVGWDTEQRRAHDDGWVQAGGTPPDQEEDQRVHAWARALSHVMFAPVVARRGAPERSEAMLAEAERAWREYRRRDGQSRS